jgi:hypothetical protein
VALCNHRDLRAWLVHGPKKKRSAANWELTLCQAEAAQELRAGKQLNPTEGDVPRNSFLLWLA